MQHGNLGRHKQMSLMGFSFRKANALETVGCQVSTVSAGDVTHEGPCYLFGNAIELRTTVKGMPFAMLTDSLPRWWLVEPPAGMRFIARYSGGGFVATRGGGVVSGTLTLGSELFPGAVSCGMAVYAQDAATEAATTTATKTAKRYLPRIGFPGAYIGKGSKLANAPAAAGATTLVTPAQAQALYVHARYYVPQGANTVGPGTGQFSCPMYLWAETQEVRLDGDLFPAAQWIIGDLATLSWQSGPKGVLLILAAPVAKLGLWSPALEQETETGATFRFCRLDVAAWSLASTSTVSGGGGSAGTGGSSPAGSGSNVGIGGTVQV